MAKECFSVGAAFLLLVGSLACGVCGESALTLETPTSVQEPEESGAASTPGAQPTRTMLPLPTATSTPLGSSPPSPTPPGSEVAAQPVLTYLPCDPATVIWMQPFGNVDHGGGNAFFHDGIDFGTQPDAAFFSSADGTVTQVELNTGKGWPGTNYRITIQIAESVYLDYHFEIGGSVPEPQRRSSILIAAGDEVEAGQQIGNLIVVGSDVAHVHWGIYDHGQAVICPLDYFPEDVAQSFETLYDSGIEKRPSSRPDLCE
jgi:murein DD-endopeptidase MepM/ murein hydrolase activator NlpD